MATGMFSWFLVGKKLCGLPLGSLWLPHQPRAAGCHLRGGQRQDLPPFLFLSVQCCQPGLLPWVSPPPGRLTEGDGDRGRPGFPLSSAPSSAAGSSAAAKGTREPRALRQRDGASIFIQNHCQRSEALTGSREHGQPGARAWPACRLSPGQPCGSGRPGAMVPQSRKYLPQTEHLLGAPHTWPYRVLQLPL